MTTRITSFVAHQTAEGMRITATYSVIAEDGHLIKSNDKFTVIVLNDQIITDISEVNAWLLGKVPQ